MTLVVTSMLFNCGGAMYNSDAAVCEKISFYKLAVQQIPHQACRSHPVKRDTGNATIHRNGTKPRSFFWKRGSHCNALCLTRFCRATAENETSDKQTLVFSLKLLFRSVDFRSGGWRLGARAGNAQISGLGHRDPEDFVRNPGPKMLDQKPQKYKNLYLDFGSFSTP